MTSEDLKTIETARLAVEEIVTARYFGVQGIPVLGRTDFDQLPTVMQEDERRISEQNEHDNRMRVGIHMCLSAASVALQVSHDLMRDFPDLTPEQRAKALLQCAEDAMAASDAARHAAAVLAGEEPPQTDSFFEISRI